MFHVLPPFYDPDNLYIHTDDEKKLDKKMGCIVEDLDIGNLCRHSAI